MATGETQISLLVLIGLPGSGKTTFSKFLSEYLEDGPVHCTITVCYDKIIPLSVYERSQGDVTWSEARKNIVKSIETLITSLKTCSDPVGLVNQYKFSVCQSKIESVDHSRILIVIDDNMYYRSMRYQYYQIARSHSLGFCQVFLKCEIEECLKRNSVRSETHKIPNETIWKMAGNLEEPNPCEYPWEKNSCVISSMSTFTSDSIASLGRTIDSTFVEPEKPLPVSGEGEKSRAACSSSVSHQVDLALRRIIGNKIRQQRQGLSSQELADLSKSLNIKKQEILHSIKAGEFTLPGEMCRAIEKGDVCVAGGLDDFLFQQFFVV